MVPVCTPGLFSNLFYPQEASFQDASLDLLAFWLPDGFSHEGRAASGLSESGGRGSWGIYFPTASLQPQLPSGDPTCGFSSRLHFAPGS